MRSEAKAEQDGKPMSHLSVIRNFVGAILAANMGWDEAGKFLWVIRLAHYLVGVLCVCERE